MGSLTEERKFLGKTREIFFKIFTLLGGLPWSSVQKNSCEDCNTGSLQCTKIEIIMEDTEQVTRNIQKESVDLAKHRPRSYSHPGRIPENIQRQQQTSLVKERHGDSYVKPKVVFNVGGVIFETLERTVAHLPIMHDLETRAHYDVSKGQYFFDRDPEVFRFVLNYWRSGKLHLPLGRCGPSITYELALWGLDEIDIQPCCWGNYNLGLDTTTSLEKIRRDTMLENVQSYDMQEPTNWLNNQRRAVWNILTLPSHSRIAKIYEYTAILFAIVAIISFCASTCAAFQIDNTNSSTISSSSKNGSLRASTFKQHIDLGIETRRSARVSPILLLIDYICLAFFTLEYIIQFICAPNPLKFTFSFSSLIDILAIAPDYVEFIVQEFTESSSVTDLLLLLRLMRIIRIFRVIRRVPGLVIMMYTLRASYKDLSLMLLFLLVGTLLFGSVIFFVDDTRVFTSIPQSFWWAIVTMTTVGYGDMVPLTPWGQMVGSLTTICGVILIGFTIPSLVNNFTTYYNLSQFDTRHKNLLAKKASALSSRISYSEITIDANQNVTEMKTDDLN